MYYSEHRDSASKVSKASKVAKAAAASTSEVFGASKVPKAFVVRLIIEVVGRLIRAFAGLMDFVVDSAFVLYIN